MVEISKVGRLVRIQHSNFSYKVLGNIANCRGRTLKTFASAIFLAKQSNKSLYLLQQTPCYFLAVTSGISYIVVGKVIAKLIRL